jgi:hypothetical protein
MSSYAQTVTRTAREIRISNLLGTSTVARNEELGHRVLTAATEAGINHRTAVREWVAEINSPAPDDQARADAERIAAHGRALIQAVRDHAQAHYDEDGWDYVVEAWEDEELAEDIGDAATAEEAIARIGRIVSLQAEHRQERWFFADSDNCM